MTRLKLIWSVSLIATVGVAVVVPLGNWTVAAQVVAPMDSDDDTIGEPELDRSAVALDFDVDFDEDNQSQPVNLISPTDEESRLAGDGEALIQKNTLTEQERAVFRADALTVLGLNATSVQEIEAVQVSQVRKVAVTLNGIPRELELYPHSLRSVDFRVTVVEANGVEYDVPPPPVTTYRGTVVGDITSEVAASVIDGEVHAIIRGRDGAWVISPVAKDIRGAPADLHAVFRMEDVAPHNGTCGVDAVIRAVTAEVNAKENQGNLSLLGTGGRTQIAFDCDNEYYVLNGSSVTLTINDLEMVMNQVALVYLGEFSPDICYVNEGVKVRTSSGSDPYTSTDAETLLCQFVDEWEANPPFSNYDVAHLMTGKNIDSSTIGIAWVGVICGNTDFTNCLGPAQPLNFGLSQTLFSNNLVSRTTLTAHELGHNWNACHCNQSSCTGGSADADCSIMWSSVGTQSSTLLFGSRSTTAIDSHRNSRSCLSGCRGTTYVDLNNATSGSGTIGNPYRSLTDGIDWVRVGGTVRIFGGNYSGSRTIRKYVNLKRQDGTVDIGE